MNAKVNGSSLQFDVDCTYRSMPVREGDFSRNKVTIGLFMGGGFKWETITELQALDLTPRRQHCRLNLYFRQPKQDIHQWATALKDANASHGYRVALESELRDFVGSPHGAAVAGSDMHILAPGSYIDSDGRLYVAAFRGGEDVCYYDVMPLAADGVWILLVAREQE